MKSIELSPGINITYITHEKSHSHIHAVHEKILEINYCRKGRLGCIMENGKTIYLGHGDFSIHNMKSCANSKITLPTGYYEGLKISIDFEKISEHPDSFLSSIGVDVNLLFSKFCVGDNVYSFSSSSTTESIFDYFFHPDSRFASAYHKIKLAELCLYLINLENRSLNQIKEYESAQTAIIREIHDYLLNNLDTHITIDELSKQFHINSTTLKSAFKDIYGDSLAAHVKKHKIEKAASYLLTTDLSSSEISSMIGYESQSKFTSSFKEVFGVTPKVYRDTHKKL